MQEVRPQPVGLHPVGGESTGSFVRRLALVNDLSVASVLREAGGGRVGELDPCVQEVFLSDEAIERLAIMSWRTPAQLCRNLPTLADGAGRGRRRPVRVEPWPSQWAVLEPCSACLARCTDLVAPVWWASGERWQVCVRHGRWLRDASAGGPAQVSLSGLPEVARAHRRWMRLRQQAGPYARALLADALQVASCWWQGRLMGAEGVWAHREAVLGSGRQMWSVPLVVYPEAVRIAEAMAVFERQRCWGREFDNGARRWMTRHWITFVGERLGMPGLMEQGGYRVLREWTLQHRVSTPVTQRLTLPAPPPGYLSQHLPSLEPHRVLPKRGRLEDVSCLEWRLGQPVSVVD
ncbi:hypothetical protein [Streptomyces sp. NPDC058644]|uniref:hypothetical protein n=1 Tax=unclassified Streptomyces TaxID=2593676 RepID=UPI0036572614